MPHAIIRGKNGRRHEVEFGDAQVRVEVHASDEVIEISVEALDDPARPDKRRSALLNVPRHLFSEAMGEAARRSAKTKP